MINIFADLDKLYISHKNDMILSEYNDYVKYYEDIVKSYENNRDLKIIIQNRVIDSWVKRLSLKFTGQTKYENLTAIKCLSDKWKVDIPQFISNDDVLSLNLLEKDLVIKKGESFENIILYNYYNEYFTYEVFPLNKIVNIIDSFDEEKWEVNKNIEVIYKIYTDKLNNWISKSNSAVASIIDMVKNDIPILKVKLMKYKIVKYYPDISKKLLGNDFIIFNNLKPDISNLIVDQSETVDVINAVEYCLKEFNNPNDTNELNIIVKSLSGFLEIEFEYLYSLIKNNIQLLTKEIIVEIKNKFFSLKSKIIREKIEDLNKYIMPNIPSVPDDKYSVYDMLKWVTDEYLPYYKWTIDNNKIDNELIEKSSIFSDWLYDNWNFIKTNSKRMIFNILSNNIEKFQIKDRVKLMIVIDNFGWRYIDFIKEQFLEIGFTLNSIESYITMIPSETEIAKKCLLSGSVSYNEIDDKKYKSIVEKGWIPYSMENKQFHYIENINKLKDLEIVEDHTYIINYLPIDTILHQREDEIGSNYDKKIRFLIKEIVEEIFNFVSKHKLQEKIDIHITSDHGSTKINNGIKNKIDESFIGVLAKDKNDINVRFLKLPDNKKNILNSNIEYDCYFIDKNIFGNDSHFLCAKQYNRFKNIDSSYYHGGLSPEEMIIPYVFFSYVKIEVKNIELYLINKELRFAPQDIEVEIANPNIYPLYNVYIKILNPNIESDVYFIENILDKSKIKIIFKSKINKTINKEHISNLSFSISFGCKGKEYYFNSGLPMIIKSMLKTKTDLDF